MVATNPTELRLKRKIMREYILRDHIMISLKRPTIVDTPAGGKKQTAPTTLDPQMFRLYPFIRRVSQYTRDTPDGDIINIRYVLLGLYDADVKAADFFDLENGRYQVVSLDPMHDDRRVANVTYRGKTSDESWD